MILCGDMFSKLLGLSASEDVHCTSFLVYKTENKTLGLGKALFLFGYQTDVTSLKHFKNLSCQTPKQRFCHNSYHGGSTNHSCTDNSFTARNNTKLDLSNILKRERKGKKSWE